MAAPPVATFRSFVLAMLGLLACVVVFAAYPKAATASGGPVVTAAVDEVDGTCDDWNEWDDPDCVDSGDGDGDGEGEGTDPGEDDDWCVWTDSCDESEDEPEEVIQWPAPPKGAYATLRKGSRKAKIPKGAPKPIRKMINAANSITRKPYKWGGGHSRWKDRGYDCSGAVSYVLYAGGYLDSPLDSGGLAKWGAKGAGNWVRIYANKKHVFMVIAGLRFDTTAYGASGGKGPRWRATVRPTKGFKLRHPAGL